MNLPVRPRSSCSGLRRKTLAAGGVFLSAFTALAMTASPAHAAGGGVAEVKAYLVTKLQRMDAAAHDFVSNANAYQKIIDASGGDYNRAASEHGGELLALVNKMQGDFRIYHNDGYETVEGITAGTKEMVDFDTYLDAGVPKSEATTDSPSAPLVLKDREGKIISDRNGNLFHYIIEPTLWGTKEIYLRRLSPDAAAKIKPVTVLPRADVLTAAADECARKMDELARHRHEMAAHAGRMRRRARVDDAHAQRVFRRLARFALQPPALAGPLRRGEPRARHARHHVEPAIDLQRDPARGRDRRTPRSPPGSRANTTTSSGSLPASMPVNAPAAAR